MTTVSEQLTWARRLLNGKESPLLEAQILLSHVLKCERLKLIAWPEMAVSPEQQESFRKLVERRIQNEPVAYLVGEKEFWSHSFFVTTDTLVPRPDTEKLVEVVLEKLPNEPMTVVDVGTGSGIIACILAIMRPKWQVIGVDISQRALDVAKMNSEGHKLTNVKWVHSRWLEAFDDQEFDAIVSNPPYLRADDEHLQQGDLSFEPIGALVSGKTGLEAYEHIIAQSVVRLKKGGTIAFEHGYDQAGQVQALLVKSNFTEIVTHKDLSGHSRVTMGTR